MYRLGNKILAVNGKLFELIPQLATVTTQALTSIGYTYFTANGTLVDDGRATTTKGFAYGTGSTPTIAGSHTDNGTSLGAFSATLTGLTDNVVYYVRAYATNVVGTSYGAQVTGRTVQITAPSVTTQAVTNILATGATANGTVTSDNGATITDRGFAWGTGATPTTGGTHVHVAGTTGAFSGAITGTTQGITYYVRAFAKNSKGLTYATAENYTANSFITSGLTSYWDFQTTGATTTDKVGSYTATVSGATAIWSTGGKVGRSILWTSGATDLTTTTNVINANKTVTVSLWFKKGTGYDSSKINYFWSIGARVATFDNIHGGFIMWAQATDSLYLQTGSRYAGGSESRRSYLYQSALTGATNYIHLVATCDGTYNGMKLYINGVERTKTSESGTATSLVYVNNYLNIGCYRKGDGSHTPSYFDELATWNRVLTQTEITNLYNSGSGIFY